jgi:curli biogenesis system outer membrane secretion channel CsgG
MKSRLIAFVLMAMVAAALPLTAAAQDRPGLKQLGVDDVSASKALITTVTKSGQIDSLNTLIDSLNQHFLVQFAETNKFAVIGRSDMARLIKEQQIPVGVIRDPNEAKALPGMIKGLDYLVVATVTEFKDETSGIILQGIGQRVDARTVQATAIVKIYDTTTGQLRKAIDVPVRQEARGAAMMAGQAVGNNAIDNSMIEAAAVELARRTAGRVVDVIYPAQVAQFQAGTVFINRGEGGGIDRDQIWEVFAVGPEIIDPATGKSLGASEIKVAEVVVTDVLPNFSKARVLGDNRGIEIGAILRQKLPPMNGGAMGPAQGMR